MPYIIGVAVLAALFLLYLFLISPNFGRRPQMKELFKFNYAHRGLHKLEAGVPENSLAAFAAAADGGFGMELDVQITKDGGLVVFHDYNLSRICGVDGEIKDMIVSELKLFPLSGTSECIPSFDEVLSLVNGKAPLVVEIKGESMDTTVCQKVYAALQGYCGDYVIESFNPVYLHWWRKNAPHVLRGQLSANLLKEDVNGFSDWVKKWVIKNLLTNFYIKPDFIAYDWRDEKGLSFRLCRDLFKAPSAFWTVGNEETFQKLKYKCDTVIFEGFLPSSEV
ncbi:MAG: glycerophosphodiester phosphodiesterase [Clostridiales bacterium]|nr:glycerophosphodiester phosphodiesterase [Clostridiales bacterium]